MSCFLRNLRAIFLAFFCVQSWAVVPAGTEYRAVASNYSSSWFSTREAACSDLGAVLNAVNPEWSANIEGVSCRVWMPSGNLFGFQTRSACPANSSESGGSCTCNAGFEEKDGQCASPSLCNEISSICKSAQGTEGIWGNKSPQSGLTCFPLGPDYSACTSGCAANIGMSVSTTTQAGGTTYGGSMKFTGGACNLPPKVEDAPKKTDCIGDKGTVGGKDVCIPPTNATGDKKSTTSQRPDGSVVERESTTTCADGKCTTTTKTTTTKPDGTTSSSSSSSTQSATDYCSKNPGSEVCSAVNKGNAPGAGNGGGSNPGSGTGSGSGSGSGTGSGNGEGEGEEKGTCGVEGKPACKVKVDETGVKDKFEGDTKGLDEWKTAVDGNRDQIKGSGDGIFNGLNMFWSAPPLASCTPLALPNDMGQITQQCDVVNGVRDAMYYIWALTALWLCIGWIREAV